MSLPATTLPTPLQPDTAAALARLADGMDGSALLWASGYLAGLLFVFTLLFQWMRASEREAAREDRRLDRLEQAQRA